MTMRVTHRSVQANTLANLQTNLVKMSKLQEQLSSGRLINRPSDNPAGTVSALQLRGDLRTTEQFTRNADNGIGWLATADGAMMESLSMLRRVRELTVRGANTGSMGPQAREALALEVAGLRDGLLGLANTSYNGRPVFGGTTAGQVAFDATGSYVGDAGTVMRRVGPNTQVRVDVAGQAAFADASGRSVFALLEDVAAHLTGDPSQLGGDLDALDAAINRMLSAVSDAGTRFGRLESLKQVATDRAIDLKTALANVESIDLPATIVDLQMQEVAYQAALGAAARVLQPTLMDFLR